MDEALNSKLQQLKDDLISASEEVSVAIEAGEDQRQLSVGRTIDGLAKRYADLYDELEGSERDQVERQLGRRMTDLRRQAQQLTRRSAGQPVKRAVDAGFVPFLEQRTPSKSIVPSRNAPSSRGPKYSVGGEIDAWCGKCADEKTHHIIAMVGDEPKQVICQTCRSRHNYRAERLVRGGAAAATEARAVEAVATKRSLTAEERESQRRQDLKRALIKELDEAADPRAFDPRGRYKPGEIIDHPEHGRGKIENVLKGSLLVRFREGLRPVNLK